ncbi:sodium:proton antiporter [Nocardia higoensis]|uniref:Sodium:proton antiporter n=1 Tax=Nocardia higoensis TaxID=228599 RepID=A0ABS0DHT9_9NOCA|nr:sodium:proton antiporter [Nocardia higoensis]
MWDLRVRGESRTEQLDRNFATLLQELRVVQTGVQVLTGILLTLPFQSRFPELSPAMRVDYLLVAAASIAATVFLTAPVAAHRMLFRRHRLEHIVRSAHRCAVIGILFLGFALTGVAVLIFDFVAGPVAATIAGVTAALLFVLLWFAFPYHQRTQDADPEEQGPLRDPRAHRFFREP